MQPKTKVLTAFLCLLPPCGVSIVSIGQQSQLFNSSLPEKAAQSGFSGLNLNTYASTDKKINLESSQVLPSSTIVKDEAINNLKVDLNFVDNKIFLPEFNSINSSVPVDSARKIIKEIKIEEGVTNIQGQATQLIEHSRKKLVGRSSSFFQAKKISKAKSQHDKYTPDLQLPHRKVIWDYLSAFSKLETEKASLLDSLIRVEGIDISEILNDSSKSVELINTLQALEEIGWINEPSQIYKHKPVPKAGEKPYGKDLGWGDWSTENPYRNFFLNEEEWSEFIKRISRAEKELLNYLKSFSVDPLALKLLTPGMVKMDEKFFPEYSRLEKNILQAHKELEKRIARKLLQDMGFPG